MTASNHVLMGAVLGALLPLPVAIPLAFVSHFIFDALPHFDVEDELKGNTPYHQKIVFGDGIIALMLGVVLLIFHKWAMLLCGTLAFSPDALHVLYYFTHGHDMAIKPRNRFEAFHLRIQRWEQPWGIFPELIVLTVLLPIFVLHLT